MSRVRLLTPRAAASLLTLVLLLNTLPLVARAQQPGAAQGRHLVHAAMLQAQEFICHELGAEFGMLFCLPRLEPFYARQGWQALEDEVEIDQPAGKVVWPYRVMVKPCGERVWPAGRVEVGGLPW